jgi:TetR/AcrR family transcriptional regulator, fatty acid metabolism regulator protein
MRSENETIEQIKRSFIETARRAQIVTNAIETLAELGFVQTSFAQIAKRAGISKGVISYHFADKDELMEQIVTDVYTAAAHFMLPQIQHESTASGMLRAFLESNFAFIAENRKAVIAVKEIISNLRTADGKLRYDAEANEPNIQLIEWILHKGQQEGEFRQFDPRVMALTIRATLDMAGAQLATNPNLDPESFANELVVLFDTATRKTEA